MSADLQSAPYFDDHSDEKNFQKILFKPQFPIQVRELNQLQTILSKQIDRLGNVVLKQGTIVSGCEYVPSKNLPFVKLKNNEADGKVVDVSKYTGKFAKNSQGTVAQIITGVNGYLDQAPNLNTIYVKYINSGASGTAYTFSADDVLTVYDANLPIEEVEIVDGSSGFSNGDVAVFLSAVKVANTSGGNTFSLGINVGDIVSDGAGANVAVASVTTSGSDTIVRFTPRIADQLASNSVAWNIQANTTFIDANTTQTFVVKELIGEGAAGVVETNVIGEIKKVTLTSSGKNYETLPTVFVTSKTATTAQLQSAAFTVDNSVATVPVAGASYGPIGTGFGVAINKGMVFQNGYITRTDPQFLVVEKYDPTPSDKVVGFETTEEVITTRDDESLYDNALGTTNYTAPGADRLKVTTKAIALTLDEAAARSNFLPVIKFSEGEPYQTSTNAESSLIDEHLAVRTFEESGNFVVDPFKMTTKSAAIADEPTVFKAAVDPGVAYINGYRVATERNLAKELSKATDTKTISSTVSSAGYGNFIVASSISGQFTFGLKVNLVNAASTTIGAARVKGVQSVGSGADRKFKVFLFDVTMNGGRQFKDVRTVSAGGFAATIQLTNGEAALSGSNDSKMIFAAPVAAVKTVNSLTYEYQKGDWGTVTANTSGQATLVVSDPAELFPIAGSLAETDRNQVIVSTTADVVATTAFAGTVAATAGNATLVGTGTTFIADLVAGEYVQYANTTASEIVQVGSVANNTSFNAVVAPTLTITDGTLKKAFKAGVPINVDDVTVAGNRQSMVITLGHAIPASTLNVVANVLRTPTVSSKTVTRKAVVRIDPATNAAGTNGPFALGHADVLRLRGVYSGSNTTFTASQGTDVTGDYYIDANHSPDSKGTGYLYKKSSSVALSAGSKLLVMFDVLTQSTGEVVTINSYPVNDALTLTASTATVNTSELPEIFGAQYFDVRDSFDFRPGYANTVAVHTTQSSAPINPTEPVFDSRYSSFARVPAPDSEITSSITYYLPRYDRVIASFNGDIKILSGQPGTGQLPAEPEKAITVNILNIPPYPSLPANLSEEMKEIVDLKTANENLAGRRRARYSITTTLTDSEIAQEQPRRYTQQDIGSLDRRLGAVEYYLALTAAESQAASKYIGSTSGNVNRFKFGFMVDSFVDSSRSEIDHPQYSASLDDGALTSKFDKLPISLGGGTGNVEGGLATLSFTPHRLIGQLLATDGPVQEALPTTTPVPATDNVPGVVTPAPTTPVQTVVQGTCHAVRDGQQLRRGPNGRVVEKMFGPSGPQQIDEFRVSQTAGPAELYLNIGDSLFGVEVFQGTVPNFAVENLTPLKNVYAIVPLTSEDLAGRASDLGPVMGAAWGLGPFETISNDFSRPARGGVGKITWNHDPANGLFYKIVLTKYLSHGSGGVSNLGFWRYKFYYPCDNIAEAVTPVFNGVVSYTGALSVEPKQFKLDYAYKNGYMSPMMPGQMFRLVATGLKPSTVHSLTVEGELAQPSLVRPVGGQFGDSLVTDANGRVELDYSLQPRDVPTGALEFFLSGAGGTSTALGAASGPIISGGDATPGGLGGGRTYVQTVNR